jgi:hypothetical protein
MRAMNNWEVAASVGIGIGIILTTTGFLGYTAEVFFGGFIRFTNWFGIAAKTDR